jgi:hypothetical protein
MTATREREEDLPILDEIGRDLAAAYAPAPARPRVARRRVRRIALATTALLVVVPGAVATRYIWAPDPGINKGTAFEDSRPIQVADGMGDHLKWRMSAFTADENLGRGLSCPALRKPEVRSLPEIAASELETLYYGWLPPEATSVTVITGKGRRLEAQIVVASPDRIKMARLPEGLRFYVANGPPLRDVAEAPGVIIRDAAGRELTRLLPPNR